MACNRCNSSGACRCGSVCAPCTSLPGTTLVPQPYYVAASACKEDHTQYVYVIQSVVGIQIQSSWNIPVCGGATILSVPGLKAISIGSDIWNINFGYFTVTAFDPIAETLTITNPCLSGNADPGVEVPACTTFSNGPPPCCEDTNNIGVFVKYDFTAPAVDDCLDITLTSVDGLITGNNVQIGSGVYALEEIKANDIVTICNRGEGITPGTPVIAQNVAGQYQYPVIQLSINACKQDPITEGKLIACGEDGQAPITGSSAGQVLTLTNVDGTAQYRNLADIATEVCFPQISVGDIALAQLTSGALVFDAEGFAVVTISTNLRELTLPVGSCDFFVKAHVSVAMQPDVVFTDGYGALYHEIEFRWDTGAFPATLTCGKVVIMQNSADDKTVLGFPAGGFPATFTQLLPPATLDMDYYQFDVEALSLTSGGTTIQLEMYYRILQGDIHAMMTVNPTRFMVSGWLEIFRRAP